MGFYQPDDMDEIGKAQIEALEALERQMELRLTRKLKRVGLEYVNRFRRPVTDDVELLAYWDGFSSVFHSIGGVHLAILHAFDRRKAEQGGEGR